MKTIRRILFAQYAIAFGMSLITAANAHASITKVGNGDDGADLEALSPIKSGPIWESRQRAVETLKKLNVIGVPGLGLLIPELERSDLLMASQDVHPTDEQLGSIEVSEDKRLVYARTFAEPYAATRFFPAAQQLTSEQLVALHIHEALHRSLPSDIRSNENTVMHLTMAMTSPGASFDRIRNVTGLYIRTSSAADFHAPSSTTATSSTTQQLVLPPKSRTTFGYGFDSYSNQKLGVGGRETLHGFELTSSIFGFKTIRSYAVEPIFRARLKISTQSGLNSFVGPSSYDLQGRVRINEQTLAGPFARFTAKSLDDSVNVGSDRDVATLGAFYRNDVDQTYFDSTLSYSLPSTARLGDIATKYKSILSLAARSGLKRGRFRIGGVAELHASGGKASNRGESYDYEYSGYYTGGSHHMNSFRILAAGPELGYVTNRFQAKAHCKWIVNDTQASLDDLGDIVDRGAGRGGLGTSFAMDF